MFLTQTSSYVFSFNKKDENVKLGYFHLLTRILVTYYAVCLHMYKQTIIYLTSRPNYTFL